MKDNDHSLIDDESAESWRSSLLAHPVLGPEFVSMQYLYGKIARWKPRHMDERLWFGDLYQDVYGASRYGSEMLHRRAKHEASRLKHQELHLLTYFVGSFETKLKGESRVSPMFDPIDLCKTAFETRGSDEISRRRRLEAMTRFIAARLLLHIDHVDSEIDVGRQAERLTSTMIDRVFVEGKSEDVRFLLVQDPKNSYRISEILWSLEKEPDRPSSGIIKPDNIPCRFVLRPDGSLAPVILDDRVKDDGSRLFKMVRKGESLASLNDKCGYTIVVINETDVDIVFAQIERSLRRKPFKIVKTLANVETGERLNEENLDSDPRFRARRLIVSFDDEESGVEITAEVNVQTAQVFFDATYSRAPENHDYYRFRQLCRGFFPFRFPRYAYGIDWRSNSKHRRVLEDRLGLLQA